MKYTKLFSVLVLALAAITVTKADTLVGNTYVSAVANVTDIRSNVTAQSVVGGTLAANVAVFDNVDFGGSLDLARLADNKVDINNFTGEFNATAHVTYFGFTPFVRAGVGYVAARQGANHFSTGAYRIGFGVETSVLKNLSLGAEVFETNVQKLSTGGNQRVYRPFATFWLNDSVGVSGAYVYNQTVNTAGASLGVAYKF